ncbi:MAG: 6-phospho-beta-glucosidase [Terrimesophilobacter sp.]
MKLVVIGGGSTYTPELVDGFSRLRSVLPIEELWLVDPDQHRLDLVAGVSKRMFARAGHTGRIIATDDVVAGVSDADVVLFQLRIGGQAARQHDETWPHEIGCIGQETTGPGGFAKALRTVPVILRLAELVRKHAKPDAWIIDFTNPVGIVTRALLEAGHHAVGLCNVAIGFQRQFAGLLGVGPQSVTLHHVGLNHLTWERGVTVTTASGRREALPDLLAHNLEAIAEGVELPAELLQRQGAVPSYYLRYFYAHDEVLREQLSEPTRAEGVMEIEKALLEKYADPTVDTKPPELAQRGGAYYSEAAVDLISSLRSDRGDVQVVNLRNNGALPFLPDDHVIEVSAEVHANGFVPIPIEPLPEGMRGLISHVASYERLALDAAISGSREKVAAAMLAHPLVGQYDRAERLTDLLISTNHEYLSWAK